MYSRVRFLHIRGFVQYLDVSVIVPFQDDEEVIGTVVSSVARSMREQNRSFEIIAVDDYSGDNSVALLALIRAEIPELVLATAPAKGQAQSYGASLARGRVLLLVEPETALPSLPAFHNAYSRVRNGELDVLIEDGFALAHHSLGQVDGQTRGRGRRSNADFRRLLVARSRSRNAGAESPSLRHPFRWAAHLAASLRQPRPRKQTIRNAHARPARMH